MLRTFLAAVGIACVASKPSRPTLTILNQGYDDFGVFFIGEPDENFERKVGIVEMNQQLNQNTNLDHGFTIRTTDMEVRLGVRIHEGEGAEFPYKICINNLSHDDQASVELQHSSSGFVWIDGGQSVCHLTDIRHEFTIRTYKKNEVVSFSVMHGLHEEM
jgi:hypothetical protein